MFKIQFLSCVDHIASVLYPHVAGWTAQMEDVSIITENSGRLLSDSSGVGHKPGGVCSRRGMIGLVGAEDWKNLLDIMMARMKILWVEGRGVGN